MSLDQAFDRQAVITRFLEHCHRRTFPAKTVIINAGDYSDELYYLVKGSVSVLIEDDDGHEIVLAYLNEGDFFGEIGMFDEKRERSAWVRARTQCEVAQISYDRLRSLSAELPEVLYAMLAQLALRLRNTSRKVGDLAFMDVSGRVARALNRPPPSPGSDPPALPAAPRRAARSANARAASFPHPTKVRRAAERRAKAARPMSKEKYGQAAPSPRRK